MKKQFKRMPAPELDEIQRVKQALPHGGITQIVEDTGYDHQIVQRTLSGKIRHWDKRHNDIIRAARGIIDAVALK